MRELYKLTTYMKETESVISFLRKTDVRHAIYYDYVKELCEGQVEDKLDSKGLLKLEALRRRLYGVYTQGKSRTAMFLLLDKYMNEKKDLFRGRDVISDIKKLIKKNAKIQAGPGHHDDSIMALLIALYVLTYGKQLNRFGYYAGEFIPDEATKDEDEQRLLNTMLEELPELKQLYGQPTDFKTSDDYDKMLMAEIARNSQMMASQNTTYTDPDSGITVTTRNLNETAEDEDMMGGYASIGQSFFDFLNS